GRIDQLVASGLELFGPKSSHPPSPSPSYSERSLSHLIIRPAGGVSSGPRCIRRWRDRRESRCRLVTPPARIELARVHPGRGVAGWCNGSTTDSESVSPGSNPGPAARSGAFV